MDVEGHWQESALVACRPNNMRMDWLPLSAILPQWLWLRR